MHKSVRRLAAGLVAATVFAASAVGAMAASFSGNFSLSGSAFSDAGLVINADPRSGGGSFDLDVGDSTTFSLFRIWTDESAVNSDDRVPQSINVSFDLTSPVASGVLGGSSVGSGTVFPLGSVS